MAVLCLGLNHRTASIAVRERLAFAKDEVPAAAAAMAGLPGVGEATLLSTCNRVEAYLVCASAPKAAAAVTAWLRRARRLPASGWTRALFRLEDRAAVGHLMTVAAGLDSQVVGEPQILAQVRDAHAAALRAGATGAILNGLFNRATAAGKRVRTETGIGRLPGSVASVAVDLAERIFGDLAGRTVLLLGTGETSELVAEALVEGGARASASDATPSAPRLLVAGERHLDRAQALARRLGGEALDLDAARARLEECDIAIVATAAKEWVLRREHVAAALQRRRSRPVFLVDLSVPRNVDPAAADLPNAYLYNVDDLKAVADENRKRRGEWVEPATRIAESAAGEAVAWLESLAMVPVLRDLNALGESLRREAWDRAGARIRQLPPETREEVEYLTRALVTKLLHRPISRLKSLGAGDGASTYTALIRKLFGLE